jgi:hypothetical protein
MKLPRLILCLLLVTTLAAALPAAAPDPVAFRDAALSNPNLKTSDGELFCWNASGAAADLVRGYEATGDARWLEGAQVYFDFLLGKLTRDPDGNEGWIGHSIWETPAKKELAAYRTDAVVGDAILLAPLLRFAEIVKADPALQARFGAAAGRYVDKAERIGWEKWNHRGAYYRDAAGYGSYRMPVQFINAQSGAWAPAPPVAHSENLNKHSAMALVMVRLWRITGRVEYRTRAEEIMARLKHLFRYLPAEDRVTWNFWMPHGPHDIVNGKLASWVAVHPNRPAYQAEEVARMVEMYDSGLVFDRADMQRLINTNHFMMPAKSGGAWRSSDGSTDAGKLWTSLARFDDKIRTRWVESLQASDKPKDQLDLAYIEKVTANELGWKRRYVKDEAQVRVYEQAPQPGRLLSATVVIPDEIASAKDDAARLVTQTRGAGELKIELLSADGRDVLGELYRGTADAGGAVIMPAWDGINPRTGKKEPGDYLVRWSLQDERRTERVRVAGAAPAARRIALTASSQQGDFAPGCVRDGNFETRWTAQGNEQWLCFDLGEPTQLGAAEIAFMQGNRRNALFALECSLDGKTWRSVWDGQSSGTTLGFESFGLAGTTARYVRYMGFGNSDNDWNSISEMRLIDAAGNPIQ